MTNRRNFIKSTVAGMAGIAMLPALNTFAEDINHYAPDKKLKLKDLFY